MGTTIEVGTTPGAPIRVPDDVFLLTAAFAREGADLRLSDAAGNEVLVRGYFAAGGTPSDLVTSDGAVVHGGTARILAGSPAFVQIAQAGGAPAGPAPIGKLRIVTGSVKVVHGGVEQDGAQDTDVYRNDVLVTGPGAAVAVRFADGTHFALGQNARMTLDSFAYNPQGGASQMLVSVLQGTFSFVSGAIAKTGEDAMKVQMPTMTIGIRGTTVAGQAAAEGSESSATLLRNLDGTIGGIFAFNSQSGYLITQTNFTAYSTSQFAAFPQPTLLVNLDVYQDALTAMQTSLRTALPGDTDVAQYNLSPLDQALARIVTGSGSPDGSPEGLNYQLVTFDDLGITLVVFHSNGRTFAAVFNTGEPSPPNADGDAPNGNDRQLPDQGSAPNNAPAITTTGFATQQGQAATGQLAASDPDGDPLTFSLTQAPILGTLTLDANGAYVYVPGAALVALASGQTATDTFTVLVSDGRGGTATQLVTVTIAGLNDAPTAPVDVNAAANFVGDAAVTGTLVGITASAFDVDGNSVTYSLLDDAGGRFAIDTATGAVRVADGSLIVFGDTYTITVAASDGTAASPPVDFTIQVYDTPADGLITVSNLDGAHNGFTLLGPDPLGGAGHSVAIVGDVNGDGFDDMLVGAPYGSYGYGNAYVVFGKAGGFAPAIALSSLSGADGFRIDTGQYGSGLGFSVAGAGDVNGDGFADLILGAPGAYDCGCYVPGAAYVIFGHAGPFAPALDVSALDGSNGFRILGVYDLGAAGYSVSSAGDINGDGFDDVIVGAPFAAYCGCPVGEAYVVFGTDAGFPAGIDVSLSTLDGTTGFTIRGRYGGDNAGFSVSAAGDVNGDGFADLIVGSPGAYGATYFDGEAYVVFGKASGFDPVIELSGLDGSNGFALLGATEYGAAGFSVAGAGDINGDGFADLIVGAPYAEYGAGGAYVVFGTGGGFASSVALGGLDGSNGFFILGPDGYGAGFAVSSAGDFNGDGFDDLIVGAPGCGCSDGFAYVIYGKAGGFGSLIDLNSLALDGSNGFLIRGAAPYGEIGHSVAGGGDVNGDGFDDLIVGAPYAYGGAYYGGEAYVIFGGNFTASVTFLGGTGANSFTGTAAAERFVGGLGDDVLVGNGGADVFEGGAGSDLIVASGSTAPLRADGGSGIDTFRADGLDDTALNLPGYLRSIEKIDLTGGTADTLVLDKPTVIAITGLNGDAFSDNTLLVKGDVGDRLVFGEDWTQGAVVVNPLGETGSYVTYTNGALAVLVESDVTVTYDTPRDGLFAIANLTGLNGFRLDGVAANDRSGRWVASAGDVNGDGYDDLIIGGLTDTNGVNSGSAYVVFGKASGFTMPVELSALDGSTGFRIDGAAALDGLGRVGAAGDVNGDGFADLIVGAPYATGFGPGAAYVVFGKASGFASAIDVSSLDGTTGFKLSTAGAVFDSTGYAVTTAGDLNGDGFDDVIVAAPGADFAVTGAGAVYVVFGQASGFASSIDLSALNGADGFRLDGVSLYSLAGTSVASAGDVNGDGFADLIVGAINAPSFPGGPGAAYVVFGSASGFASAISLSALDGTTGFRLDGAVGGNQAGRSVASAGDVNGDGFDDVIVGAPYGSPNNGRSYVVFGHAGGFDPAIALSGLDGTTGFRLDGVGTDQSGRSVSSAGDVNGDGFDDLIVGTRYADHVYIVYGKAGGFASAIDLSALDGSDGFRLDGAGGNFGTPVAAAGDVNGDGFDDLIVGATLASPHGAYSGSSYVLFGGDFTASVTFLGDSGANSFTGTAADERFVGGQGDDVLTGNGGADVFEGGAGNDLISVADLGFQRVDGGGNDDRLLFEAAVGGTIDLGDVSAKIQGIEQLDFTNGIADAIDIEASDILDLAVQNSDVNGEAGIDNAVTILGEAGDTVNLLGGWTVGLADSGGAGFTLCTYDAAPAIQVVVDNAMTVNAP